MTTSKKKTPPAADANAIAGFEEEGGGAEPGGARAPIAPAAAAAPPLVPAAEWHPRYPWRTPEGQLRPGLEIAHLEVPLAALPAGAYCARHIEVRLDAGEATLLKRLALALDRAGATTADGRRVTVEFLGRAVRWLLARLGG